MSDNEESANQSALQENISRKGSNSYYYAHGKKIDGPKWDGKEEPRLLSTETVSSSTKAKILIKPLESFSWLDETKSVKIYVDFDAASEVPDEALSLSVDESNLDFKVTGADGSQYALLVGPLYDNVESWSVKKKSDKFLIVLKKQTETSWVSLKKSS